MTDPDLLMGIPGSSGAGLCLLAADTTYYYLFRVGLTRVYYASTDPAGTILASGYYNGSANDPGAPWAAAGTCDPPL